MSPISTDPHQPREASDLSQSSSKSPTQADTDPAGMASHEQASPPQELKAWTRTSNPDVASAISSSEIATIESAISTTLDKFTLFPKLPAEMRCKIWFHSLSGPRIVEVDLESQGEWFCRQESQGRPCGMLRANKEYRTEFLNHYSPFLEVLVPVMIDENIDDPQNPYRLVLGSVTYIDPKIDTLYISANHWEEMSLTRNSLRHLFSTKCLQKIESIACEYHEVKDGFNDMETITDAGYLPNIKTVLISIGDITYNDLANCCLERSAGEITFSNPEDGSVRTDQQTIPFSLRIDEAKKMFLDPTRKDSAVCTTARIFRGGVEMDFKILGI